MSRNNNFKNHSSNKPLSMKSLSISNEVTNESSNSYSFAESKLLDAVSNYMNTMRFNKSLYHSIMICLDCNLILLSEKSSDDRVTNKIMENYIPINELKDQL